MRRKIALIICFLLLLAAVLPAGTYAQETETDGKVVRVGWFESTFCYTDPYGRKRGIDYEYQHRIAAYTGWTFEYVEDSWPNLLGMLESGEIDLLSDVSFTEERAKLISYPDLPMGTESYYIYIDSDNREISSEDLKSFNGRRIGVNKGSVQEGFLRDWAKRNDLSLEVVPLTTEEAESMEMIAEGEIDGYASTNTFGAKDKVIPVSRIGASDYYYGVNRRRPDLLAELNMALSAIQDEDPYYNQKLSEEQLHTTKTNAFLTPGQKAWLEEHGAIRVGYQDQYLPFCQQDKATGELTGALSDYLLHAADRLKSEDILFESVPYPTAEAALAAMKAGDVDCVFPLCLSAYDSDELGIRLTDPAMKTGMDAVMRTSEKQTLSQDSVISVAVSAGSLSIETFIKDHYPACRRVYCTDIRECLEAVASGEADCVFASSYRASDAEDYLERRRLYSVPTGESMPLSFAVREADRELYFILNKTAVMANSQDMDSALANYTYSNRKVSFARALKDNWIIVIAVIIGVFLIIILLLLGKQKAERRAAGQQRLLEEAARTAEMKQTIASALDHMPGMNFTKDAETGAYIVCNQAFAKYAHKASPDDVAGLTDADIFDAKTAAHFMEDDRMALSMEEPYVFIEDVRDAVGNQRQFQITKLKYTDASGRLCLLGIYQDMTDTVRVEREIATTKEAYEKVRSTGIIYTHIAQALARGYNNLYYINLDSEEFTEYRSDNENGSLSEVRRGYHFFEECRTEAEQLVHPDDRDAFVKAMDRRTLVAALDRNRAFVMTYRLMLKQGPTYVTMKISRMEDDERCIVMGITNVDEQMKERRAVERIKEEKTAYARITALTGTFICVYIVDPVTNRFRVFSVAEGYEFVAQEKEGSDFFLSARERVEQTIHPDDRNRFLTVATRENILAEIERFGIFTLSYRIMMKEKPLYVQFKAAMVEENEERHLIVGINDIDAQVRQEEEYVRHLAQARMNANIDALTGVKNRHAYLMAEERLNLLAEEDKAPEFAIVILDVNDLKEVNDTSGHSAGDQYIRDACKIICDIFKHSPVFRIGGDEFAVIVQGSDYQCVEALLRKVNEQNAESVRTGGIVIACGMAKYGNDDSVASVFERADREMYQNKSFLKSRKKN